jgi:hypothetical protein
MATPVMRQGVVHDPVGHMGIPGLMGAMEIAHAEVNERWHGRSGLRQAIGVAGQIDGEGR